MDDRFPPRAAWNLRRRTPLGVLALTIVFALTFVAGSVPAAAADDGPRLLYLPMRWCVLEGSQASRGNPTAAVLERIRRANSILAPKTGISLRSPVNRSLGDSLGFPVIRDPAKRIGRPGDVRTPVESLAEYELVVARCEQAWQRAERAAGKQISFGGLAKGPIGVIIRDFVSGSGTPVNNVWGFALSARSNSDYCNEARIRQASGGSLMVVDSRDGSPDRTLDRRLVAHEVGHILRLGHGDGLDNPGSIRGLIDKYCDDAENPDIVPGSLMTPTLRYENVEAWQQRLPRNVVAKHPAAVGAYPFLRPRVRQVRVRELQRIANGGWRVIRRLSPRSRPPLSPLPRLWSAGVRGDDFADRPGDLRQATGAPVPPSADLDRVTVTEDDATGEVGLAVEVAGATVGDAQVAAVVVDADGDPTTGGSPSAIPGLSLPEFEGVVGIELVSIVRIVDGETVAQAWLWDPVTMSWVEVIPPPGADLAGHVDEEEHDPMGGEEPDSSPSPEPSLSPSPEPGGGGGPRPFPDTLVVTIPAGLIELAPDFRTAALLRTEAADGEVYVDLVPTDPAAALAAMSKRDVEYPVCAVNRDSAEPGHGELGRPVTLEVDGFDQDGTLSVWLGDSPDPIAELEYTEMPCDWPWVGELTLPEQLSGGGAGDGTPEASAVPAEPANEGGLQMLQVVLEGTGLTADCPIIIGDPPEAEWFTEDDDEAPVEA